MEAIGNVDKRVPYVKYGGYYLPLYDFCVLMDDGVLSFDIASVGVSAIKCNDVVYDVVLLYKDECARYNERVDKLEKI